MASIQQDPSGNFHVCFRFRDHRFERSLKTNIRRKAEAAIRIEENLRLVDEGRIELPDGVDVPAFLLPDGKLTELSPGPQGLSQPVRFSPSTPKRFQMTRSNQRHWQQ